MELPVDEEDDEQMVRVPEPLEVSTATLLHGEPDHDGESSGHDPAGYAGTCCEVGGKEGNDPLAGSLGIRVGHRELSEVDHVCGNMNDSSNHDGPGSGFVESDVLVERNDIVERCAAQEGDEVAADRQQNEGHVDV